MNSRIGVNKECKVGGEVYNTYIPVPLPPTPPIHMENLQMLLSAADVALGRLDGITSILPDPNIFIGIYVIREAVLSSQIEGTQSSLSELLLHDEKDSFHQDFDDVTETFNYVAALQHGIKSMKDKLPLSLRLIRDMHAILLKSGRGSQKQPGEFRTSQNWIGGTRPGNARFCPPPPEELKQCLYDFEHFLHHNDPAYPVLIRAALAHLQFETIHPFLDGNGRLGRLLITLMLCNEGVLKEPMLYLSLYFKQNRDDYYKQLTYVRETGDWEEWIHFFLRGVVQTAEDACEKGTRILRLFAEDVEKVKGLGRIRTSATAVLMHLQKKPSTTIANTATETGLAVSTVTSALEQLIEMGIVREVTQKSYGRIFSYYAYMEMLNEGLEPL